MLIIYNYFPRSGRSWSDTAVCSVWSVVITAWKFLEIMNIFIWYVGATLSHREWPPPPTPQRAGTDSRIAGVQEAYLQLRRRSPETRPGTPWWWRASGRTSPWFWSCFRVPCSVQGLGAVLLSVGTEQCCRVNPANCPLDLGEGSLLPLGAPACCN